MTPARIQLLNERAASLPRAAQQYQQRAIERIGFVIPRVAARLPWRSDCLIQAVPAQRWLASCGVASAISIGVDRGLMANSWLTPGSSMTKPSSPVARFHLTVRFWNPVRPAFNRMQIL